MLIQTENAKFSRTFNNLIEALTELRRRTSEEKCVRQHGVTCDEILNVFPACLFNLFFFFKNAIMYDLKSLGEMGGLKRWLSG